MYRNKHGLLSFSFVNCMEYHTQIESGAKDNFSLFIFFSITKQQVTKVYQSLAGIGILLAI